jgi:hypothetical protein
LLKSRLLSRNNDQYGGDMNSSTNLTNATRMVGDALFGVLMIALLSACATTAGGPDARDQVAAATRAWIDAMGSHDPERVVALYDPEAVLWGTTSPTLRDNPASVSDYFKFLRTAPPYYKGVLGEQRIRVYGDALPSTPGPTPSLVPLLTLPESQLVDRRGSALFIGIEMVAG